MKRTLAPASALVFLGFSSLAFSASCGGASPASGTATSPGASRAASASQFLAAIDAVRTRHPDALVYEVEIDRTHHAGTLEVEYFRSGALYEIFFDPGTMEVIEDRPEPEAAADFEARRPLLARLEAGEGDLRAFLATGALDRHGVDVVREVELALHEGTLVVSVELVRDGVESRVLHALDGAPLDATI